MIVSFIFICLTLGFSIGVSDRHSIGVRYCAFFPILISYVFLYVFVSEILAQDREAYYNWYIATTSLSSIYEISSNFDPIFNLVLYSLPADLNFQEFKVVFAIIVFLFLIIALLTLCRDVESRKKVALIAICIVTDRLFLDASMNTTRSTLAALIFLSAFATKKWSVKCLLITFSLLTHFGFAVLIIIVFAFYRMLRRSERLLHVIAAFSILILFYKYVTQEHLVSGLYYLEYPILESNIERINRANSSSSTLTTSLLGQIFLALIFPYLVNFRLMREVSTRSSHDAYSNEVISFAIVAMSVSLFLFPDFLLVQRLFVIPLILLLLTLRLSDLKWLSAIKLMLFAIYIGEYIN